MALSERPRVQKRSDMSRSLLDPFGGGVQIILGSRNVARTKMKRFFLIAYNGNLAIESHREAAT